VLQNNPVVYHESHFDVEEDSRVVVVVVDGDVDDCVVAVAVEFDGLRKQRQQSCDELAPNQSRSLLIRLLFRCWYSEHDNYRGAVGCCCFCIRYKLLGVVLAPSRDSRLFRDDD